MTAALATTALTADEARHLTEQIRVRLDFLLPLIKQAFEGRADRALGYESWQAYCTAELGDVRVPLGDRPAMVAELRQAGMSTRAIGSALGVDDRTVRRDLSTAAHAAVPDRITGTDGREQPARRTQAPEPVAATSTAPAGSGSTTAPAASPPSLGADPAPAAEPAALRQEPDWTSEQVDLRKRLESGETIVVSLRAHHADLVAWATEQDLLVRVDRRTDWGNPFEMPADGDRGTVVAHYQWHYLPHKPSLTGRIQELKGKALACWCAPKECHADVLAELANGGEAS